MRIKTLLSVSAVLLFATTLMSSSSWAATVKNCPTEPTQNVPIASGDDYAGSNCVLHTPGDVDSFVFGANDGDTYQMIVAYQGGNNGTYMTVYDPNGNQIFPINGQNNFTGNGDLVVPLTLTVTGQYTIVLTMGATGNAEYALSLERINPFPPDAQPITLAHAINGSLAPPNEQATYTFYGSTTGTYLVSVSYTGGSVGTCIYLYYPGSTSPQPPPDQGCTGNGVYQFTFNPPQNDTYMLLLTGGGDDTEGSYSLEVTCYLGTCKTKPPKCELTDSPTYSSGTLTMNFTVGTPVAVTWNGWLTVGNKMTSLFSQALPITEPPTKVPVTKTLSPSGEVGILSTFTTKKNGITCSNWVTINTGSAK